MRLHVAAAARVVVHPPGAADAGFLFEQQEVLLAPLLEANGHAEAGKAAAEDGDLAMAASDRG